MSCYIFELCSLPSVFFVFADYVVHLVIILICIFLYQYVIYRQQLAVRGILGYSFKRGSVTYHKCPLTNSHLRELPVVESSLGVDTGVAASFWRDKQSQDS